MPVAMLFDTLELSKALQPSFTPEQAEALVHALGKASSDQLATKADIVELRAEISALRSDLGGRIATSRSDLEGQIAKLRSDLEGQIGKLRSDLEGQIADLRADVTNQISLLRADMIKWIVSAIAFNFVATAGLIIALTKVFGK